MLKRARCADTRAARGRDREARAARGLVGELGLAGHQLDAVAAAAIARRAAQVHARARVQLQHHAAGHVHLALLAGGGAVVGVPVGHRRPEAERRRDREVGDRGRHRAAEPGAAARQRQLVARGALLLPAQLQAGRRHRAPDLARLREGLRMRAAARAPGLEGARIVLVRLARGQPHRPGLGFALQGLHRVGISGFVDGRGFIFFSLHLASTVFPRRDRSAG
jgi:hypothetical protein